MKEIVLVKYGEMALKGLNKKTFEDMLTKNIKRRIKSLGRFICTSAQSTLYITPEEDNADLSEVVDRVGKIFGIAALCRACVCEKDFDDNNKIKCPESCEADTRAETESAED